MVLINYLGIFCLFFRGGLSSQEDGFGTLSHFQPKGRLENWEEDQILIPQYPRAPVVDFIKQESNSQNSINLCNNPHGDEEFQLAPSSRPVWSPVQIMPVSSPRSCVTSLSNNNILDFTYNKADNKRNQHAVHSSEVRKNFFPCSFVLLQVALSLCS